MQTIWRSLVKRYYDFFYDLFNALKFRCVISINFNEPWWKLLARQKLRLFLTLVPLSIVRIAGMLSPLVLAAIIAQANMYWLLVFLCAWCVLLIIDYVGDFNFTLLSESAQSIQFYAHQLLLRIDPIFHATRDTGQIVAKIDRATQAYQKILDTGTYELMFMLVQVATAVSALWVVDKTVGFVALLLNVLIIAISVPVYLLNEESFFDPWVVAEDKLKSIALENLSQIGLIRSAFAGNEAMRRLRLQTNKSIAVDRASWGSFCLMNVFMRMIYFSLFCVICALIIKLTIAGMVSVLTATTLVITYFGGTYNVTKFGRYFYLFITDISRIQDLFIFLRTFGKQTFPVLSETEQLLELPLNREGNIQIEARNLQFQYDENAQIFNGHSLILTVPSNQKNKLYGIIGPSGVGKTTLLSILGGQLRPNEGTVLVNGVDIYAIDDYARRTIIAVQSQTATTLRGSVRYNLLFGLPETVAYGDVELCDILQKVGIWHIFEDKKGLETPIGEGGFTLSGGQRQRFNFASLYLRARCYKPLLILMDEPTSSLDEISERAITTMMMELSMNSVVCVIAHRLQTITNAVGILDISLIRETKKMRFYPKHILAQHSRYYQLLLEGAIDISDGTP